MASVLVKVTRGLVLLVAWSFFVISILGVVVTAAVVAWPNGIDSAEFIGLTYHVGLAYEGWPGVVMALGEAAAVFTCLLLSRSRRAAPRRIGHLGLCAWASLILVNALFSFDAGDSFVIGFLVTIAVIWVCVVLRAVWFWRPPARHRT
jgi:hypothetical protein